MVTAEGVGFDGDDLDGAGVNVWVGDNQGNVVFLWTSAIGDYESDTEPLFTGGLSSVQITQVTGVLADHSGTGEWVCVNWANRPVVTTPRTTSSPGQRCAGADFVSQKIFGWLYERDGLGPFWIEWDEYESGWTTYLQVHAPVDEYCSSDDWSVWRTKTTGRVRVRQEDGQIRTFYLGMKTSGNAGGDCEG